MHKSKLVRTFQVLTPAEAKRLHLFLKSPFYNANSNVVKLNNILFKQYSAFDSPKLSKEAVFKKLFPGRSYAHQQLLNLMSEFYALLEKYLTVLQLEKKEIEQKKLLLDAFAERPNSYHFFEKKFEKFNVEIDELPFRDELYFNLKKELNLQYYSHPDTNMQTGDKGSLHKAVEYYEAEKTIADTKLKCALNARKNTLSENHTRQTINPQLWNTSPSYFLYDKLEQFQRSEKAAHFDAIFDLFKSNIEFLRKEDKRNLLKMLLNYSIRKANSGDISFYHPSLMLYKIGLEHDCLLANRRMSKNVFTNIVSVGAIYGDFDWTEQFINEYKDTLDNNIKEDAVKISMCVWHFERKEFDAANDVARHSFSEPMDALKSKLIQTKSLFELWQKDESYYDILFSQLDAFEKFIRREKTIRVEMKNATLQSISFTKKLIDCNGDKKATNKLRDEVSNEQNLVLKRWLLKKLQ